MKIVEGNHGVFIKKKMSGGNFWIKKHRIMMTTMGFCESEIKVSVGSKSYFTIAPGVNVWFFLVDV